MTVEFTHHNSGFVIDNHDWRNHESDAEEAATMLQNWVETLDATDTAALHAALADRREDHEIPADMLAWRDRAMEEGRAAKDRIMEGWTETPAFGFNCDLGAVED